VLDWLRRVSLHWTKTASDSPCRVCHACFMVLPKGMKFRHLIYPFRKECFLVCQDCWESGVQL